MEFTVRQKKAMIDLCPVESSQQPIGILQLRQRLEENHTVFKVIPFEFAKAKFGVHKSSSDIAIANWTFVWGRM